MSDAPAGVSRDPQPTDNREELPEKVSRRCSGAESATRPDPRTDADWQDPANAAAAKNRARCCISLAGGE